MTQNHFPTFLTNGKHLLQRVVLVINRANSCRCVLNVIENQVVRDKKVFCLLRRVDGCTLAKSEVEGNVFLRKIVS